jgi:hypothetical protein
MNVPHLDERRHDVRDLLTRPPCTGRHEEGWAALLVDPAEQLTTLAELVVDGWLSVDEFERQKAKVIDPWR